MDTTYDLMTFNTPTKPENEENLRNIRSNVGSHQKGIDTPTEQKHSESFRSVSTDFFQTAKLYDVDDGRESLMLLKNMEDFDAGRESLMLLKNIEDLDTGRESLMLLKNMEDFDTGRESLMLLKNMEDFDTGRESLMLLKNMEDFDTGRESLMLLKDMEDFDVGRESLGIIHLNLTEDRLNDTNWLNISDVNVSSYVDRSGASNTNLLYPNRSPGRAFSVSSYNSRISSINCGNFDAVSMLSSIKCEDSFLNSQLNKGFFNSRVDDSAEFGNIRTRLNSLPVILEGQLQNKETHFTKSESLLGRSFTTHFDIEENEKEDTDNQFNDSVFIEAQIVASKIADGSILEDNGDVGLLDATPQPDWLDDSDEQDSIRNVKPTSEDIFKRVDKMLPMYSFHNGKISEETSEQKTKIESKRTEYKTDEDVNTQSSSDENTIISPSVHKLECFQNLSNIFLNKSLSTSKLSCGSGRSKSRDAKDILDNLSDILNASNPTSQQKAEGQNLLYSLADILHSSKSSSKTRESVEDSGHSSIEIEQDGEQNDAVFVDIMDLRTKPLCEKDNPKPLDLSKNLNRSLSCPSTRQTDVSAKFTGETESKDDKEKRGKEKNSNILKRISKSQASLPKLNSFGKMKSKKSADDVKKKGPLRAILPIGNMAKAITRSKTIGTPPRAASSSKSKAITTPKTEHNICAVAQSTPDGSSSDNRNVQLSPSKLPKPRFSCPVSPLARPGLKEPGKIPSSSALNSLKPNSLNSSLNRRKSASDIKVNNAVGIKRSNSISKDSIIAPSMNRVRDSILRHTKETNVDKKNSKPGVEQKSSHMDRLKSTVKPFNLMSKLRRSVGKENVAN